MQKRFAIGLLLTAFLLGALPAQARASLHDHHGANPFAQSGFTHKMHCLLHGHHIDGPCPHLAQAGSRRLPVKCAISQECGGKPVGTRPASGPSVCLAWGVLGTAADFPVRSERLNPLYLPFHPSAVPDLQDPPPQSF